MKRFPLARLSTLCGLVLSLVVVPAVTNADPVSMIDNAVIIDNGPFFNSGPEDHLGGGNYALNHPSFIDIPYAIFDFRSISSVGHATLTWNFGTLFGNSPPAQINLYVGSDADGVISPGDRFMGAFVDTFTYSGGELRSHDVTAFLNTALLLSPYFAARLEAAIPPAALDSYYGGQFLTPSLSVNDSAPVPEPASLALVATGLGMLARRRMRRKGD